MAIKKRLILSLPGGEHVTDLPSELGPFSVGDYVNVDDKRAYRITGPASHGLQKKAHYLASYAAVQIQPEEIPFELRYPFVTERDR